MACILVRKFEYQADEFAVKKNKGALLITGLTKIYKDNSGDLNPDEWYAAFNHTHPGLVERIVAI